MSRHKQFRAIKKNFKSSLMPLKRGIEKSKQISLVSSKIMKLRSTSKLNLTHKCMKMLKNINRRLNRPKKIGKKSTSLESKLINVLMRFNLRMKN